jgi:hypothetical protein
MRGAAVKDREGAVRQDRAAMENDARWIYNDFERGFAEAKKTGKPLLVVLRCVPCLSCVGLDAEVLTEPSLGPLLDQFVCVRVINANALDLARFQFDYDLSFSTLIFNADGTLYGRYGSWTHQVDPEARETIGYRRALEAALALHRGYPANRASLAGKQGGPIPFKTPLEIPGLAGKYGRELNWGGNVVQSCVHCHQVGEAYRASYRDQGKPVPLEQIYPMPAPETIGLTLAPDATARVAAVMPASIAASAGFRVGDEVMSFDRQPLISIADFAWVLHRAPATGARNVGGVDRHREAAPLELAGRRHPDDAGAQHRRPPLGVRQRHVGGHRRRAPRQRHARAAVAVVVDDGLGVELAGLEDEARRPVRTQAHGLADDALGGDPHQRQRHHRPARHGRRRDDPRRPRRAGIQSETGEREPAVGQQPASVHGEPYLVRARSLTMS